ncbi:MAG: YacL family protein [Thalassotalea sp.]
MEYQYRLDPATGNARALFSFEHEIIGPWLEVEIGDDIEKLTQVLTALDEVSHGVMKEKIISGREYSVIIEREDISVRANVSINGSLNGQEGLPEGLAEQGLALDDDEVTMCGLEDFREMLLSWTKFLSK